MKKTIALPLLLISLLLSSCATYERCADKYGVTRTDTLLVPYEKLIPVQVAVPADCVAVSLSTGDLHDTTVVSAQGLSLNILVDTANGEITLQGRIPPRVIHDTVSLRDTVLVPAECLTLVEPPTLSELLWSGYKDIAAFGFIASLIIIYILIKAIRK